jgi:CheY-like chemotaxis protein
MSQGRPGDPSARPTSPVLAAAADERYPVLSHRFLIVDDDPLMVQAIAAILTTRGFAVLTAQDGQEALDIVATVRPSLVFLDLHMPVLDGWGFVRALDERGLRLPIVVMSSDPDLRRWAAELGAVAYLSKPFGIAQLFSTLELLIPGRVEEPEG